MNDYRPEGLALQVLSSLHMRLRVFLFSVLAAVMLVIGILFDAWGEPLSADLIGEVVDECINLFGICFFCGWLSDGAYLDTRFGKDVAPPLPQVRYTALQLFFSVVLPVAILATIVVVALAFYAIGTSHYGAAFAPLVSSWLTEHAVVVADEFFDVFLFYYTAGQAVFSYRLTKRLGWPPFRQWKAAAVYVVVVSAAIFLKDNHFLGHDLLQWLCGTLLWIAVLVAIIVINRRLFCAYVISHPVPTDQE